MSNTPFFIYWDIFYCIYYDICNHLLLHIAR